MFSARYKTRKLSKQRLKSQQKDPNSLTMFGTFIRNLRKSEKIQKVEDGKEHRESAPTNMNILINGKIIRDRVSPLKIKSPSNNVAQQQNTNHGSNIRDYIYRRYQTVHGQGQQEFNPHMEAMIRLRQIFNQRNRSKNNTQHGQKMSEVSLQQNKKELEKIINVKTPNIYTIKCLKKYTRSFEKKLSETDNRKYLKQIKNKMGNKCSLNSSSTHDKFTVLGIDPWDTD